MGRNVIGVLLPILSVMLLAMQRPQRRRVQWSWRADYVPITVVC